MKFFLELSAVGGVDNHASKFNMRFFSQLIYLILPRIINSELCSVCSVGTFQSAECQPSLKLETECEACSECRYGTFIQHQCNSTSDTVCAPCTKCNTAEYELSECAAGRNTVCGSCHICDLEEETKVQVGCRDSPKFWHLENCGTDLCPF